MYEGARTKLTDICFEIAETAASVAFERGYEIPKESIRRGIRYIDSSRKEF